MKKILIGLGVVVLLVLGVTLPRGNSVVQQIVGANPGPDSYSPYNSFNGIQQWYTSRALTQASSTICAIKSPSATSTLVRGSVHINTNTTASTAVIGKATTAFATTTLLGQNSIAAGTELNLVASTSPISNGALTFSPNTYMVVGLYGSAAVSLTGKCQATFEVISN